MTAPRKPQDRKPRSTKSRGETTVFSFTHDGEEYSMPSIDTLTPGFLRRIRDKNEVQQMFDALEELAGDESATEGILDVVDNLSTKDFQTFSAAFMEGKDVTLGESSAS